MNRVQRIILLGVTAATLAGWGMTAQPAQADPAGGQGRPRFDPSPLTEPGPNGAQWSPSSLDLGETLPGETRTATLTVVSPIDTWVAAGITGDSAFRVGQITSYRWKYVRVGAGITASWQWVRVTDQSVAGHLPIRVTANQELEVLVAFAGQTWGDHAATLRVAGGDSWLLKVPVRGNVPSRRVAEQIIFGKARSLGSALTGDRVSDIQEVPGGFRVRYQGADIYCATNSAIAFEVHGHIRAKYDATGGPWGALGLPVTDEREAARGGRYNHFSRGGSIYWTDHTGPMIVQGAIRDTWEQQGWEWGALGYPIRDEQQVGPGQWFSDFENGVLYWENGPRNTLKAKLTRPQLASAIFWYFDRNKGDDDLGLLGSEIFNVQDYEWDFRQSLNRKVYVRIWGYYKLPLFKDLVWELSFQLRFYGGRSADGQTHLMVELANPDHVRVDAANGFGYWRKKLMDGLLDKVRGTFQAPLDLSGGIPSVLSVKVTREGGLTVYVQPSKLGEPDRNTMIYRAVQDQLWQFARVPEDQQIYRPDDD